jgi:hypothetical protein
MNHAVNVLQIADVSAMHIHPTVSELIPTMLGEFQPISETDGTGAAR